MWGMAAKVRGGVRGQCDYNDSLVTGLQRPMGDGESGGKVALTDSKDQTNQLGRIPSLLNYTMQLGRQ